MAQYTIDNNRSINANSRDNFSRGEKNTFIFATSEDKKTYLNPNRIQYIYQQSLSGDDRYWLNDDYSIGKTQYTKIAISTTDILFGLANFSSIYLSPLQINTREI